MTDEHKAAQDKAERSRRRGVLKDATLLASDAAGCDSFDLAEVSVNIAAVMYKANGVSELSFIEAARVAYRRATQKPAAGTPS